MWSDESRFTLDFNDGRIRVHRLPGERFAECCVKEHDRYGGGSVMIWAAMWFGGRTAAVKISGTLNGERYKNIIQTIVVPTASSQDLTFQDDNATPHRASTVRQTLEAAGVTTLPWPSRSPDLSPIEHAWDNLGRKVRDSYALPPTNLTELAERLLYQWSELEQSELDTLCDSMPRRLTSCIQAKGGHTKY